MYASDSYRRNSLLPLSVSEIQESRTHAMGLSREGAKGSLSAPNCMSGSISDTWRHRWPRTLMQLERSDSEQKMKTCTMSAEQDQTVALLNCKQLLVLEFVLIRKGEYHRPTWRQRPCRWHRFFVCQFIRCSAFLANTWQIIRH